MVLISWCYLLGMNSAMKLVTYVTNLLHIILLTAEGLSPKIQGKVGSPEIIRTSSRLIKSCVTSQTEFLYIHLYCLFILMWLLFNYRWRIKIYRNVFSGTKFVDWLLDVGLARDRIEAVNYARHLIEGKVLKHINNVHHFYDRNLLYTFV